MTKIEVALAAIILTGVLYLLARAAQRACDSRSRRIAPPIATAVETVADENFGDGAIGQTVNPVAGASPVAAYPGPDALSGFQMNSELKPEMLQQPAPSWANDESLGFLPKMAVQFSNEIVGRGSHGVVYKGRLRTATGIQDVAIKQLAPGATEREARHFVKEFQISLKASQRCPGAAMMYGCVLNDENALCLVMKLYRCSLNHYLEERRDPVDYSRRQVLAPAQVADFGCQMANILAALHASKIIVQDLKPSNVLLDEHDNIVIADYGLAVMVERSIVSSSMSTAEGGTAAYMAPEQYDSSQFGKVSDKTDVWALGCIISEMLTGSMPWAGKRYPEIMTKVLMKQESPAIPPSLPDALYTTLRRCLVHTQAKRASALEVVELLQPLLEGAV